VAQLRDHGVHKGHVIHMMRLGGYGMGFATIIPFMGDRIRIHHKEAFAVRKRTEFAQALHAGAIGPAAVKDYYQRRWAQGSRLRGASAFAVKLLQLGSCAVIAQHAWNVQPKGAVHASNIHRLNGGAASEGRRCQRQKGECQTRDPAQQHASGPAGLRPDSSVFVNRRII
jgi:hypothetical protein